MLKGLLIWHIFVRLMKLTCFTVVLTELILSVYFTIHKNLTDDFIVHLCALSVQLIGYFLISNWCFFRNGQTSDSCHHQTRFSTSRKGWRNYGKGKWFMIDVKDVVVVPDLDLSDYYKQLISFTTYPPQGVEFELATCVLR